MNVVVMVAQGSLGRELVSAAQHIVGDLPHITAVDLPWDATFEEDIERLGKILDGFDATVDILIVTDMFGSTPHNVAMEFHRPGRVEVVSGANLPMIVRLGCLGAAELSIQDLPRWISEKAQRSICTTTANRPNSADGDAHQAQESQRDRKDLCDG